MLSIMTLCVLVVAYYFFQTVQALHFISIPQEARYINVNVKGDGYFVVNKIGDVPLPIPERTRGSSAPNGSVYITVDQRSNYLENLYAMDKLERDKRILEDLKHIIRESGKLQPEVKAKMRRRRKWYHENDVWGRDGSRY